MGTIVVVGAGAIGGWLASTVSASAPDTCTLLVRPTPGRTGTWLETITVHAGGAADEEPRRIAVRTTADVTVLKEARHIVFCVKEADADAFLVANESVLLRESNASVAFMSSRFPDWRSAPGQAREPADKLRHTLFESGRMVGFACWVGASTVGRFEVRQDGARGELMVGSLGPAAEDRARDLHAMLEAHGVPVRWRPDILADMWVKAANSFVWNSAALLTRMANGRIGQEPGLAQLVMQALEETDALAGDLGIVVRTPAARRFAATAAAAHHKMSMLQDLERSRPTEYPQLYASFMNCRASAGSVVPVATTLARLCGAITGST